MTSITRREWHQIAIAGIVSVAGLRLDARQSASSAYKGVTIGVQSYSFRDMSLDDAIKAMTAIGLRSCELWQGHVEPRGAGRDELRRWRETVSLDEFHRIKEKLQRAQITLSAYNISFQDSFSSAEIERGFEMAKALDAPCITASANINTVSRIAAAAARHRLRVGMHNHSRIDANEFATPQNFEAAMKAGPQIVVNLDIGHFTAANFDAVDFLRRHHASIVTLHIKDRRRNQGRLVPFGEGDAPIGPVLRLLRDEKWRIPANIEYEYEGSNTIEEVRRCLEYCRQQLDS